MNSQPPRSPDKLDLLWAKLLGDNRDYIDENEGIKVVMRLYKNQLYIVDMIEV